jgi:hypothetical protein
LRSPILKGLIWGAAFGFTALASAGAGIALAILSPDWATNPIPFTRSTELPGKRQTLLSQDNRWNSLLP